LFRAAEKKVRRFWEAVEEEEKREEQITFPFQYHAFLCDIFNIPEELRDTVTISELEDELQK